VVKLYHQQMTLASSYSPWVMRLPRREASSGPTTWTLSDILCHQPGANTGRAGENRAGAGVTGTA